MKKNCYLFLILFLFLFFIIVSKYYYNNNVFIDLKDNKKNELLSMMLETEANSGKYQTALLSEWPTDEYVFNENLSKCENGGVLSWDDVNKKVIMEGNVSDKCYVYFDVKTSMSDICLNEQNLSDCIKSMKGKDLTLYYHDSSLSNGAGDNSYRYAGASNSVNNYVCFGSDNATCPVDNLYRIIGVFDGRVKLIKADYATSSLLGTDGDYSTSTFSKSDEVNYKGNLDTINRYYWNYNGLSNHTGDNKYGSNTWSTSLLNKTNLNTNYLNNIGSKWANMIDITTWKVGGNNGFDIYIQIASKIYQNEIVNPVSTNSTDGATEYSAKLGLMYVSDYGFAADPSAWIKTLDKYDDSSITSNNWMYMGLQEFPITRGSGSSTNVFLVLSGGSLLYGTSSISNTIRPVFYLKSSLKYVQGNGTKDDPIRITI